MSSAVFLKWAASSGIISRPHDMYLQHAYVIQSQCLIRFTVAGLCTVSLGIFLQIPGIGGALIILCPDAEAVLPLERTKGSSHVVASHIWMLPFLKYTELRNWLAGCTGPYS